MHEIARLLPRGFWVVCVGVFFVGFGARLVLDAASSTGPSADSPSTASLVMAQLSAPRPAPRTVVPYRGLGAWIDAFDLSPAYQRGAEPPLKPAVVEELADRGVRTVFVQAARADRRAPGRLLEEVVLAELVLRAHARGMAVIGWYLPRFDDVDRDLDHLLAIAEFDVAGHRFDGVAVDIELIEAVPDARERSERLVELSARLRKARPREILGAIVPPPVQLEVVNPSYWPRFPWRELDSSYDVWLPMAYWTTRGVGSTYRDPYAYVEESIRRLRNNIGRSDAMVHPVGGIGDATTLADLHGFRSAIVDSAAIGASIYDWNSLSADQRSALSGVLFD